MPVARATKKNGSKQWFLIVAAIICAVSDAAAQTYVKIGIISPTFGHAPFYVARDKGFFRNEGLVGEVIVMNRDDLILQSLVADSIQFTKCAFPGPGTRADQPQDDRGFFQRHNLFHHCLAEIQNT